MTEEEVRRVVEEALAPILERLDVLERLAGKLSLGLQQQSAAAQRAANSAHTRISALEELLGVSTKKKAKSAAPAAPPTDHT